MKCDRCPCPDICLARPAFCREAAKEPPSETVLRHICERSKWPEHPSAGRQLVSVAQAAARVVAAAVTGNPVAAGDDVVAERRTICNACPELVDGRCRLCGCYYETKIRLATEACPIGKW